MKANPEKADHYLDLGLTAERHGDFELAVKMFRLSVDYGGDSAANSLGVLYETELKSSGNDPIKWYKLSARRGYQSAAHNLALEYKLRGDHRKYRYWVKRAIDLGFLNVVEEIEDYIQSRDQK